VRFSSINKWDEGFDFFLVAGVVLGEVFEHELFFEFEFVDEEGGHDDEEEKCAEIAGEKN
jgi:hypothetical protein